MAVHAPALPRTDVWHGRYGSILALGAVILPFAVVLALVSALVPAENANMPDTIRATAAIVDDHAAAMIRIGDKIDAAAAAAGTADATWLAFGRHMASDGRGLQDLSARLRQTASVVETDPMHSGRSTVAIAALQARWEQLRTDGRAAAEHGRVMVDMARQITSTLPSGAADAADIQEIERASAGMIDAGEHVVRCANTLLASIDQMRRWLGR